MCPAFDCGFTSAAGLYGARADQVHFAYARFESAPSGSWFS